MCRRIEGAAADRIFRICSDPVLLFWFQWSGWSKFMVKFGYLMIKVGLHKGFPLMYCTVVEVFYYCRTYYKAVRVGGEESGGHVL